MSYAMTNREIEDVLTSIRRLVSQEGTRNAEIGRLVLTESQRISPVSPLAETLVADPDGARPSTTDLAFPAPDFGRLEATIAELEAAVSASGGTFEGDSAEEGPRASNVTELYGRVAFAHRPTRVEVTTAADAGPGGEEAPADEVGPSPVAAAEAGVALPMVDDGAVAPGDAGLNDPDGDAPEGEAANRTSTQAAAAVIGEDALEPAPGEVEAVIDEAMLRALVAQLVREELHGELGGRITLQVRKLVRAEVAKALDERKFL